MAILSVSVSELRRACVDPEWRRQWREGHAPSLRPEIPPGAMPAHGTTFHLLAERFTTLLMECRELDRANGPVRLWQRFFDELARDRLRGLLETGEPEAAHHLAQCLKAFCRRLTDLRKAIPDRTWADLFVAVEAPSAVLVDTSHGPVRISGRIDALRRHPVHGLEIVDYKLSTGDGVHSDLVQMAIYARLLSESLSDRPFRGVLEYYGPDFREVVATREELAALFNSEVMPVLEGPNLPAPLPGREGGDHAGQAVHVLDLAPELPGWSPPPGEGAGGRGPDDPDRSSALESCLSAFRLHVRVTGRIVGPQITRYVVRPAPGVKVVSLADRAEDIQVALGLNSPPIIASASDGVHVDIPRSVPDTVFWRDLVSRPEMTNRTGPLVFPVGVGPDNRLVMADMTDSNMAHALVAGVSGGGKSEFLKSLVASLIAGAPVAGVSAPRLTLIDPKILTFSGLESPHLDGPVITDTAGAVARLEEAVADMGRRYEILAQEGLDNLAARVSAGRTDIPFHVFVIDEFADLILAGKAEKKAFETLAKRLTAKGRAAGIHLVLATQRPDREIVTGLIKSNCLLRICFRVTASVNSGIILGQSGAESLLGKGDLLCDAGRGMVIRAQGPYIPQAEFLEVVRRGPVRPGASSDSSSFTEGKELP